MTERGNGGEPVSSRHAIPGNPNTKLGAVQVNMVDYKLFSIPDSAIDPQELLESRAASKRLLESLRTHTTFVPPNKDKTVADIELRSNEIGARLALMFQFGKPDDPFYKPFDLPLPKALRGQSATDLHDALRRIARVEPGGNIPNMVRNIAHVMGTSIAPRDLEIDLYSTKDSVFQEWMDSLPEETRARIRLTLISPPPRKGLHLQYDGSGTRVETLGIGTPMHSTIRDTQEHFANLISCNHVLVSESLTSLVNSDVFRAGYWEFQNPSSAFADQCPLETYNHMLNRGKHIPFIARNDGEMADYITSLERRRAAPTSEPPQRISFAPVFDGNRRIHTRSIADVTTSFQRYFACITPKPENELYFPISVSCAEHGGYHIACSTSGDKYVVYSSVPHHAGKGSERILSMIGNNDDIHIKHQLTMGAGDAVASVLSLTHLWDLQGAMRTFARKTDPLDARFIETASMIFVSLLSRVAGGVLYHSVRCDWSSIPKEAFAKIVQKTARKSLDLAGQTWKALPAITTARESDWDIDVAMWRL